MSMMTGTVESVSTKDVNTKFGTKPTFSMKVNGTWIKCGFKDPKVEVGYEVEFDGISGTYGVETKSVNILSKGSGTPTPPSTGGASVGAPKAVYGGSKVFPIPALHGDRAIVRQNALARATDPPQNLVTVSLNSDFLASPKPGDWLEAHVKVIKTGSRMSFGECQLKVGEKIMLRSSGVFAVITPPNGMKAPK